MSAPTAVEVLVNPAAGGGRCGRRWPAIESLLRAAFPMADIRFSRARGEIASLAAAAAERGSELVVAVGGDGTLHEAVQGLMSLPPAHRPTLGHLPLGSGADFARGQGIPKDPAAALRLLQEGRPRPIDLGRLRVAGARTEYFINAADCGVGACVVERMARRRRLLPARTSYLWQSVAALIAWRNPRVRFQADDGPWEEVRIKALVLANNPYFGGGMCIAPAARVDSGALAFVVFGDLGRLEAVRRLGETYGGAPIDHPRISYRRCRRLRVESSHHVPIEADGEFLGHLPLVASVEAAALRVMLPG